jgi:2-keto-3-deoxy-6-phosphogluconate aldolase
VGMGSHLFTPEDIQTKNWKSIESKVRGSLDIIRSIR